MVSAVRGQTKEGPTEFWSTGIKGPGGKAPCQTCPAGIDIPRYVRLVSAGKFIDALSVIRERIPFPSICGHVCFHPCEAKCRMGTMLGQPIAINALKRFVADQAPVVQIPWAPVAASTGKKIAVVGAGPAGLSAAFYLATLGHAVTVFESRPETGGMMRYGIPEYRLPREALAAEIRELEKVGVKIITGKPVASLDTLKKDNDAVFVAIGAQKGAPLGLEGENSPGVIDGISFLRDVASGKKVKVGGNVGVIGGGNRYLWSYAAAIDCARTVLRLGAKKVTVLYRRPRPEMPAAKEELDAAAQEGVTVEFLVAPTRIKKSSGGLKLDCVRLEPGGADASGRLQAVPVKGSEFSLDFDTVIAAAGQETEVPANFDLVTEKSGTVAVDKALMTGKKGIFAGGDAVSGPSSVIQAIAAGKRAADSIDNYLGGKGLPEPEPAAVIKMTPMLDTPSATYSATRAQVPALPAAERKESFAEVDATLTSPVAIKEAKRCLGCGLPMIVRPAQCRVCTMCEMVCSVSHQGEFNPSKSYIKIKKVVRQDGIDVGISFTDKCDSCGLCSRYCNYGALLAGGAGVGGHPVTNPEK